MRTSEATRVFLLSLEDKMLAENTIALYGWALRKLEVEFPDNLPTTPRELRPFFNKQSHYAYDSQLTIRHRLSTFWNWLVAEGICESIPVVKIAARGRRRTLPRVLSEDEVQILLEAPHSQRDYTILVVLLDTGLRIGELWSLSRKNASPEGLMVTGKVGSRSVPISPRVYELLDRQGDERWFWIGSKGRLECSSLKQIVRACMLRAGFSPPKLGPHTLRHTFGVQYMVNGGDVASLQYILGHAKVESTMLYVRMSNSLVVDQHRKFSPMREMTFDAD